MRNLHDIVPDNNSYYNKFYLSPAEYTLELEELKIETKKVVELFEIYNAKYMMSNNYTWDLKIDEE